MSSPLSPLQSPRTHVVCTECDYVCDIDVHWKCPLCNRSVDDLCNAALGGQHNIGRWPSVRECACAREVERRSCEAMRRLMCSLHTEEAVDPAEPHPKKYFSSDGTPLGSEEVQPGLASAGSSSPGTPKEESPEPSQMEVDPLCDLLQLAYKK